MRYSLEKVLLRLFFQTISVKIFGSHEEVFQFEINFQ